MSRPDSWQQEPRWHLYRDGKVIGRVYQAGAWGWCWAVWPPDGNRERCGYAATFEQAQAAVEQELKKESPSCN